MKIKTSTLRKIIKEEILRLNENTFFVSSKEIPDEIKKWVKSILHKNINKYSIDQSTKVNIDIPWHENDTEYWQLFQILPNNKAKMLDFNVVKSGNEGPESVDKLKGSGIVPKGTALVCVGTYPPRVTVYSSEGAIKPFPIKDDDITDDEITALESARSLYSPYRPKYNADVYKSLIEKGYMKKNKAITNKGLNLLNSLKK